MLVYVPEITAQVLTQFHVLKLQPRTWEPWEIKTVLSVTIKFIIVINIRRNFV